MAERNLDQRMRAILEYVRGNPSCEADDLDKPLVKNMIEDGLLRGHVINTIGGPDISGITLTIKGAKELKRKPARRYDGVLNILTKDFAVPIFVGVVAGLIAIALAASYLS